MSLFFSIYCKYVNIPTLHSQINIVKVFQIVHLRTGLCVWLLWHSLESSVSIHQVSSHCFSSAADLCVSDGTRVLGICLKKTKKKTLKFPTANVRLCRKNKKNALIYAPKARGDLTESRQPGGRKRKTEKGRASELKLKATESKT